MSTTLHAIFDGEASRPEEKVDLEVNARYKIIIEHEGKPEKPDSEYPLTELLDLATDMGVEDLAANHDKYAHRSLTAEDHPGEWCDDFPR